MSHFTGDDGWPCEFEDFVVGRRLINAIQELASNTSAAPPDAAAYARSIFAVYESGKARTLARNRDASRGTSKVELDRLVSLVQALSMHISQMRKPAITALCREGRFILELVPELEQVEEDARHAFSAIDDGQPDTGKRIAPDAVSELCAELFKQITDQQPTRISSDGTMQKNNFTSFLSDVFEALGYETDKKQKGKSGRPYVSIESQAKHAIAALALMEKSKGNSAR